MKSWPRSCLGCLAACMLHLMAVCGANAADVDYLSFATEDEANSTEIFRKASPAVVFVTNKALRRSFFSLDIQEIPRGSGTGFVWPSSTAAHGRTTGTWQSSAPTTTA